MRIFRETVKILHQMVVIRILITLHRVNNLKTQTLDLICCRIVLDSGSLFFMLFIFLTFSSLFSNESELFKDVAELPNEQDLVREEAQKMSSLLPTMWLGAQNGW